MIRSLAGHICKKGECQDDKMPRMTSAGCQNPQFEPLAVAPWKGRKISLQLSSLKLGWHRW